MSLPLLKEVDVEKAPTSPVRVDSSIGQDARGTDRIYYPELDGLRFLAFMMVFLYHFALHTHVLFDSFVQYFWAGVDLFFALSAFLFAKLLTTEYAKWNAISFRKFYLRRVFRIWPIYFLFISFVVLYYAVKVRAFSEYIVIRIIALFTFTDNIACAFKGITPLPFSGHLWTIGYEEQFYLFVPLMILFLARSSFKRRWIFYASVFALFTAIRIFLISIHKPVIYVYYLPFTHFEAILLGLIIGFGDLDFLFARMKPLSIGLLGVIFFALFCLTPNIFVTNYLSNFTYLFVGLSMSLILVSVTRSALLKRIFSFRPFVFLGKRSYGLYVYHLLGLGLAISLENHLHALHSSYLVLLVLWLGITILIAVISYRIIEVPFLNLKKKFEVVKSRPI